MKPERYTETLHFLRHHGYREAADVVQNGDFMVQGDTITVWPAGAVSPWRFHYFGEELERSEEQQAEAWIVRDTYPQVGINALHTEHGEVYPGEYVVHPFHGIGIFKGVLNEEDFQGKSQVYLALEYAGNDRLLVPWDRRAELMPYIGTRHPRLTRLYSKSWSNTKERVKRDLIHIARQLLKLYAARQLHERSGYPNQFDWQDRLASGVDFELTSDQQRSLQEIQADLSTPGLPMDRLLCGDVGFGKTEVALRAAAQVIAAGKQVAFIAPTTVLVEQHAALLQDRFKEVPVNVAHMSRLTKATDEETLRGIATGTVDLVVGTHRLLGADVVWKELGLLIVDEEQKFGVIHKDRLKELRPSLDVLSLSATPIPRTLSMSLSGLRGLSILRHPPQGRLPIKTMVEPFNEARVTEALRAELARKGQVYVVHDRVRPLEYIAERMRELVAKAGFPHAVIEVAHGQLPELELARRVSDFLARKIDILVASTIVEHGLDSPGANTLLVLRSERFGLADLYQIRGRVGRRSTQAYAYFFTGAVHRSLDPEEGLVVQESEEGLSTNARARLNALLEAEELGSGWTVAVRDLEIRGGGNILGHEQHGSMEAIGLLLYAQLLQEEIGRQALQQGIQLFQKQPSQNPADSPLNEG